MTKTLLLTGASTGLGLALAVQAAQAGYKVYATMRDLSRRAALDDAATAAGVSLTVLQLDVQDTASIASAVDHIIGADTGIDVLVNNAGIGYARTTEQAIEADIDRVMDINFMGTVRCTKAVLPHMRAARTGHIIAITSVGGLVGQPFNEIYCASKFAVEGYMESLATYAGPAFGIAFTSVEPGGISSEFANSALKQIEESGGLPDDEYLPIIHRYLGNRDMRQDGVFQTPQAVADVVLNCLASATPPVRLRTSEWAENFCRLKTEADPDGTRLRDKVLTEVLGGLPDPS